MSHMRCSKCKQPLDVTESDLTIVNTSETTMEIAFSCDNPDCDESFSIWIEHKNGWANSDSETVDLRVAKGGSR